MKYLTITVPCYNSQDYMRRCIDSLLAGGKDVEIIIVDDGSTDDTAAIADEYEAEFPDIVKAVHKENGGHGSGVNAGMKIAKGLYFKVVDSDDWFDKDAYLKLLDKIKELYDKGNKDKQCSMPDLFVCNYVYDHLDSGNKHAINYKNIFPEEKICTGNDMGHFRPSQYLIMHSIIFRTAILKSCDLELPKHTFYVDNIFAYKPLPYVKSIYYLNVDLYHYYIGREDQSVNENVMKKRIDQQLYVTSIVYKCVDLEKVKVKYPKLASYMKRNISIMISISSIHLLLIGTDDAYRKRLKLVNDIKQYDRKLYHELKYTTLSGLTYLPGTVGKKLVVYGYRAAKKLYQFQ